MLRRKLKQYQDKGIEIRMKKQIVEVHEDDNGFWCEVDGIVVRASNVFALDNEVDNAVHDQQHRDYRLIRD
jgi:hypothetical protein